ncbi:Hint domain-containing protein [Octadecabacter sp. 1_MG-2023]|uniref:Hint domain-containing protein n=1 Tax=unclassified Octadecabacter TaxID=196158 RepID=UPI001C0A0BE1|nr:MULTISPECIES: Hint domain-containing protein [unclassified Octadecabacter]MBU2994733.1 Hint domain-containing protein [Octadecabacter sp. B2R22]MDO6733973.1 Hint domain-containing protein [Octadecabacter sp. 1_MG-2023]
MFAWKTTTWEKAARSNGGTSAALPKLDTHTTGMVSGTKVATNTGWAKVETIREGQQVLTFDGGLQTVIAVTRHVLMADTDTIASWPMAVPAGALGNHEEMTLLPHQSVMIESDAAENMTGDPFAVIPAAALEGYRGITQTRPSEWVEVIQLHFAQDEIVFANIGALFLCHAQTDLISDAAPSDYAVLPMDVAEDLVDCLMFEDDARAPVRAVQYAVA